MTTFLSKLIILLSAILLAGCNPLGQTTQMASAIFCPGINDGVHDSTCSPIQKTSEWVFNNPDQYNFNQRDIEISSGKAQLKRVKDSHVGNDFISGKHIASGVFNDKLTLLTNTNHKKDLSNLIPAKIPNLKAHWTMEENWDDSSGNGNTLTSNGAMIFSSESKVGDKSGFFNGSSYLSTNSPSISNQSFSYMGWFFSNDLTNGQTLIGWGANGGPQLRINTSGRIALLQQGITGLGNSNGTIKAKEWNHIVCTNDGTGTWKIYINGVLDRTIITSTIFNFSEMQIGVMRASTEFFTGYIDDLSIWDTPLSDQEIRHVYQAQKIKYSNDNSLSPDWTPHWNNLKSYWKMEGDWRDSSTSNNHGTVVNTPPIFITDSQVGKQSANFSTLTGYVNTPMSFNLTNFTISAWSKITTTGIYHTIIGSSCFQFGILNNNQIFVITTDAFHNSGTNFPTNMGIWSHVAITKNGNQMSLYLNGNRLSTTTTNRDMSSCSLRIAGDGLTGIGGFDPYKGQLDDIAIWDTNLSSEDITLIYNRQKQHHASSYDSEIIDLGTTGNWIGLNPKTSLPFSKEIVPIQPEPQSDYPSLSEDLSNGLLGLWHLNEPTGTVGANSIIDSSGNNYHATPNGNSTLGMNAVLGAGFYSRGGNFSVTTTDFHFPNRDTFSFSFYLKTSFKTSGNFLDIIGSRGNGPQGTQGWLAYINGNSGRLAFTRSRNNVENSATSPHDISDGLWHHYVGTYDGSELRIYQDGIVIGSQINTFTLEPTSTALTFFSSTATGSSLDEVAIWNRALSQDEVTQLYRRGSNRIKYLVKSCIDSACNCKSYAALPTSSSDDCNGNGIPNSLDPTDPHLAKFIGPGGDAQTYYSEVFNREQSNLVFNCATNIGDSNSNICNDREIRILNSSLPTSPHFIFSDMATNAGLLQNRYFQYKIIMEADKNTACEGKTCLPELSEISFSPSQRFYGGSPTISPKNPIAFNELEKIEFSESGDCTITYQLSADGTNFFYWDGLTWSPATNESSDKLSIESNIKTFKSVADSGNLFFKAFMNSDTTQSCALEKIQVFSK